MILDQHNTGNIYTVQLIGFYYLPTYNPLALVYTLTILHTPNSSIHTHTHTHTHTYTHKVNN
jgi:hypothetical protein